MKLPDLHARLDVGLPIFVLVDPLAGEPVPLVDVDATSSPDQLAMARAHGWGRSTFCVHLDDRAIPIGAVRKPYLVELSGVNDPWLQKTLRMAADERGASHGGEAGNPGRTTHRIGGWLQGHRTPPELAQELAIAMLLRVTTRVPARYLRLADRRVLDWVRHIVGDERVRAALPAGLQWHYLASSGDLATVGGRDAGPASPLTFAPDEWKRLQAGPAHHATAARWYGTHYEGVREHKDSPPVADVSWARIEKAVIDAERAASRHPARIRGVNDISAWAALALRHPEDAIESTIQSLNELTGSSEDQDWSVHSQYRLIESALSDWRK